MKCNNENIIERKPNQMRRLHYHYWKHVHSQDRNNTQSNSKSAENGKYDNIHTFYIFIILFGYKKKNK